jgi:hypothetical protein
LLVYGSRSTVTRVDLPRRQTPPTKIRSKPVYATGSSLVAVLIGTLAAAAARECIAIPSLRRMPQWAL